MVKEAKATSNSVVFTKRFSGMVVALSLLGLGLYAISNGRRKHDAVIGALALLFSGALNLAVGLVLIYRVLMQTEA